jgi:Cof subfamily protein (haloacid dehalogenase superfamily)
MRKKIVFFDFDGTLFHHQSESIPASAIQVLEALANDPLTYVVLATGRTHYNLTMFRDRKKYFDGYIFLNGLHTEFQGTILDEHIVSQAEAAPLIQTLEDLGLVYGAFAATGQYISAQTEAIRHDFASVSFDLPPVGNIKEVHDIQQLFCFTPHRNYKDIEANHPNFRVIPWDINGCDIIPKHASKAIGIRKILAQFNEPVESFAFGDAINDVEMFQTVDVGIAMGNAIDELKAVAKKIAPAITEDGVYHVAKEYGWIK